MLRLRKKFFPNCFAEFLPLFLFLSLSFAWAQEMRTLPDKTFQELSTLLSEPSGQFPADNLLTNETSYLHVVPWIKRAYSPERAYIGVGPDQNFSYIIHSRPALAFIVDIRSDNRLQHLYFKQLIEMSANRWDYLSLLFGKPLPSSFIPDAGAEAAELTRYFSEIPESTEYFEDTFDRLWKALHNRFPELVSEADYEEALRIASVFFADNLELTYRMFRGRTVPDFPTFRSLMTETDLTGKPGHYLNSEDDFQFLKRLQGANRIIPVVGNFGGNHALASVGRYLAGNNYTVDVFYFSNVEFYLIAQGLFANFIENLKYIPFDDESLIIRSFFNHWYGFGRHPEAVHGYYVTSLAQAATRFLRLHQEDPYLDYWDLVTRDYLKRLQQVIP